MVKNTTGTKLTLYLTFAVLAGFAVILLMNAATMLGVVPSRYISQNDVRGIAVEHDQRLYTLNFSQQKELVEILNRLIPVGKELAESRKVTPSHPTKITKIIIYRFNAPDLILSPVSYVSKTTSVIPNHEADNKFSLVFSVPEWNANGLLEESTSDELNKLLSTTYSP